MITTTINSKTIISFIICYLITLQHNNIMQCISLIIIKITTHFFLKNRYRIVHISNLYHSKHEIKFDIFLIIIIILIVMLVITLMLRMTFKYFNIKKTWHLFNNNNNYCYDCYSINRKNNKNSITLQRCCRRHTAFQ